MAAWDLEDVLYYLTTKRYPDTVAKWPGKKANLRRVASKFTLVDGKLHTYRNRRGCTSDDGDCKKLRVIINSEERQRMLRSVHEGGDVNFESKDKTRHIGQDKTEIRLLEECWWPGIRKDVRKFVNNCLYCQFNNKPDRKSQPVCLPAERDPSPDLLPTQPWERIGVEICHIPKSRDGFSFLAVVVDYYSVWIEAEPLSAKTPVSVADFLYRLLCRHGCADYIQVIDVDKEFAQRVSGHLQSLVGVRQNVTGVSHSQASECVDTYSQMIQDLLMKVLNDPSDVEDWPKALPGVLFTFRIKPLSSSSSPFSLLYGRSPQLPVPSKNKKLCGNVSDGCHVRDGVVGAGMSNDGGSSLGDDDLVMTVEEEDSVLIEKGHPTSIRMEDCVSDDGEPFGEDCGQSIEKKVGKCD